MVKEIEIDLTKVCDVTVEGIDQRDAPNYCDAYISDAWIETDPTYDGAMQGSDGKWYRQFSEMELDALNTQSDFVYEQVINTLY